MRRLGLVGVLLLLISFLSCGRHPSMADADVARPTPPPTRQPAPTADTTASLGALAYVKDGDIWVRTLPDGVARQLTHDRANRRPRWSPSGDWLAFCNNDQLRIMRSDGADVRTLGVCDFAWSPVDDTLVYWTQADRIALASAGSWRERVLNEGGLTWSPDGAALAYAQQEALGLSEAGKLPERQVSLRRINTNGANPKELFTPGAPSPYDILVARWHDKEILYWTVPMFSASILADGAPLFGLSTTSGVTRELAPQMLAYADFLSISPDGKFLAVTEGAGRETWANKRIVTINLASGARTTLTDERVAALWPAWSPDSRQIAYVAGPDSGMDYTESETQPGVAERRIWLMQRDGSGKRQLTNDPAFRDERPQWAADGKHILFTRIDQNDQASLWMMKNDGSGLQKVASPIDAGGREAEDASAGFYGYIDWSHVFDWHITMP